LALIGTPGNRYCARDLCLFPRSDRTAAVRSGILANAQRLRESLEAKLLPPGCRGRVNTETHLCALPTGEHCPRGLVCLGCTHAQPKKSAVPVFRRMLASHQRSLDDALGHNEPAGQIAARKLELVRISTAACHDASPLQNDRGSRACRLRQ